MANMTLEEALGIATLSSDDSKSIHINPDTRQFIIPSSQMLFGVESDEDVEVKHFVIDGRYYKGTDLSKFTFRVNYRNANPDTSKNKDTYLVPSITANENSIEFDWVVGRSVVAYKGTIAYVVCAYTLNSDGTIKQEWNTTLGLGTALEGLEVGIYDIGGGGLVDELKSMLNDILIARDDADASAKAAERYATAANSAATTAAKNAADTATKLINDNVAEKLKQMQDIQTDVTNKQTATNTAASTATKARDDARNAQKAAANSATDADKSKSGADAAAKKAEEFADKAAGYAGAATFAIGYDSSGMLTLFMDNA